MPGPGIACPACGLVMQLHVNGGCPTDSFEEAMMSFDDNMELGPGEFPAVFVELLTLRQYEHATGDGEPLIERLAELAAIDLAAMLRASLGIIRYSIENTAAEQDRTTDALIQQVGIRLAAQSAF